jgi:predicted PurR-regulated permease PerM
MTIRATALAVLLSSLAIYILHESATLVAPVFVSLLVAYALEPAVALLMRARLSRVASALVVYLMIAVIAGSLARQTVAQVSAFAADLPGAIAAARSLWTHDGARSPSALTRVQYEAREPGRVLSTQTPRVSPGVRRVEVVTPHADVGSYVTAAGLSAALLTTDAAVVGLLSFLMVCSGDLYKRKLVTLGGHAFARRRLTVEVIHAIDRQIERYLIVRLAISAIVAIATGLGLWLVGVSHPIVWGVVAGALNVLPFIGPTVAVALIATAAFLQFKAVQPALVAGAVATAVAALEGNLITPTLTSRTGEINIVAVFVSVLFWGWLWGVAGLLLAVPIMVAVKAAADHIEPLQPLGELLGL